MDNLILSGEPLNQQVCTECLNYLSVGPVLVSCKGKIICGRCSPTKPAELNVFNQSLYNMVAEKLIFRCINYYEGCEELLNFNEAIQHEKHCKKDGFKCPFCGYKGNGCQLVHHFDKNHSEYVVKGDNFKIIIKEMVLKSLIFIKQNNILCMAFSVRDNTFIEFFNLLISPPVHLAPKHFKLRFFKSDTNIEFVTSQVQIAHELENFPWSTLMKNLGCDTNSNQIKNSFLLDQTSLLECFPCGWCLCKIELIENFDVEEKKLKLKYLEKIRANIDKKIPTDFMETNRIVKEGNEGNFDINCIMKMSRSNLRKFVNTELYLLQYCINCKKYITPVVYFCPKYHMACQNCVSIKCIKCDIFCIWSTKPKFNISLPCEWNGCSDCPDIVNYVRHKRDCIMRQYKCPDVDCEFEGDFVKLKKHWHVNPILDCNEFEIKGRNQNQFWHISDYHEILHVSLEYVNRVYFIIIRQVDVIMPFCYKFQLDYKIGGNNYRICEPEILGDGTLLFQIKYQYPMKLIGLVCLLK